MVDLKAGPNPLFLREEELRQAIELLYFAYRGFTGEPDRILADYGFGRAHHRVIYFVGRHPAITVSALLGILGIVPQVGVFCERVQLFKTQQGCIPVKDASSAVPLTAGVGRRLPELPHA